MSEFDLFYVDKTDVIYLYQRFKLNFILKLVKNMKIVI